MEAFGERNSATQNFQMGWQKYDFDARSQPCEMLRDPEMRNRGVYSGVLGFMDVGGCGDFSILIRTAFPDGHKDVWGISAGCAVTIRSDIEAKFHKIDTEASSVLGAMYPASIDTN